MACWNVLENCEFARAAATGADVGAGTANNAAVNVILSAVCVHAADITTRDVAANFVNKFLGINVYYAAVASILIQVDATQLPFATHSMDIIVSNLMLQWCNDFQAVAMEFARILKPDGILLFSTLVRYFERIAPKLGGGGCGQPCESIH